MAPHENPGECYPGATRESKIKTKRATPRANPWSPLNLLEEVEAYLSYIALCFEQMLVYIVVKLVLLTRVGVTIVTPIAQALFGKDVERIKIRAIVVTILCVKPVLVDKNFYLVDMVGERVGEGITTLELDHPTALLLSTPPPEVAVDKHHLAEDGAIWQVALEVICIGFVHIGDGIPIFFGIFYKRVNGFFIALVLPIVVFLYIFK